MIIVSLIISKRKDFIVGEVKSVSDTEIEFVDGKKIADFDILVLSTGSYVDSSKLNAKNMKILILDGNDSEAFFKHQKEIESAKKIAIIGSGAVGIEHLGSICEVYPEKIIYMISRSKKIMERSGESVHTSIMNYFKPKKNCMFKLGESIEYIDGDKIKLSNEEIQVDLIFSCIGFSPKTDYLIPKMSHVLDKKGYLKVNQYNQVEGYSNIFGMGDVTNMKESKLAQTAMDHSDVISNNIDHLILGKPLESHQIYDRTTIVSLGSNYSIVISGSKGVSAEGYMLSYVKAAWKYKLRNSLK